MQNHIGGGAGGRWDRRRRRARIVEEAVIGIVERGVVAEDLPHTVNITYPAVGARGIISDGAPVVPAAVKEPSSVSERTARSIAHNLARVIDAGRLGVDCIRSVDLDEDAAADEKSVLTRE